MTEQAAAGRDRLEGVALVKEYAGRRGSPPVRAVGGVDLAVRRGELVALVGESGSGKSTLGRIFLGLEAPTSGELRLGGTAVVLGSARDRRAHWRSVQLVFQDPFSCLNPTKTVGQLLSRPFRNFLGVSRSAAEAQVRDLLELVNLAPGASFLHRYPHELSGGQRQRVVLARALAVDPEFIVADEPVSMLDVSVRAGVLALMDRVRRERNVGVLYITHDLISAQQVSDRIVVLYAGRVMEQGPVDSVIGTPSHPYTRVLLAAVPGSPIGADVPKRSANLTVDTRTAGCPFVAHCPLALARCASEPPPVVEITPGHSAWCHALSADAAPDVLVRTPAPADGAPSAP